MASEQNSRHRTSSGKQKAHEASDRPPNSQAAFLDRLGSSASRLVAGSLLSPGPEDVTQRLASIHSSGRKVESTYRRRIHEADAEASSSGRPSLTTSNALRSQDRSRLGESWNSRNSQYQEDIDIFLSQRPSIEDPSQNYVKAGDFVVKAIDVGDSKVAGTDSQLRQDSVLSEVWDKTSRILPADGAAVVELLSQKGPISTEEKEDLPFDETIHRGIYAAETAKTSAGFGVPEVSDSRSGPFALLPGLHKELLPGRNDGPIVSTDIYMVRSQHANMQEWIDILDTYHDEVWGDALPVAQAARQDLEEARRKGLTDIKQLEERPAVQRLRMLLGHMNFHN